MASPSERDTPSKLRLSFRSSLGSLSRRGENNFESYKLVDLPFTSLQSEWSSDDESYGHRTKGNEDNNSRQMYLRSYPFSRKRSLTDKVKFALKKLKATAWAVVACNYKASNASRLKWKQYLSHGKDEKYIGARQYCSPLTSSGYVIKE